MGWWSGVGKALDVIGGLTGGRGAGGDTALQPRGLFGSLEERLAGVLVAALQEAFARDAARLEAEREQADAERRQAEAALQLEVARQAAERQMAQLRVVVALDAVVWVASLLVIVIHPLSGTAAKVLLACAWSALTAGLAAAFVAYGRLADPRGVGTALVGRTPVRAGSRVLDAASWLTVSGLGLAAASVMAIVW